LTREEFSVSKPKRKLIATTMLGYLPIEIYHMPGLGEADKASGRFCFDNGIGVIEMEPRQDEASKYDTLLHELIHAADCLWALGLSERKVRELATMLCQALRGLKKAGRKRCASSKRRQ
jgi:hypothetical protein